MAVDLVEEIVELRRLLEAMIRRGVVKSVDGNTITVEYPTEDDDGQPNVSQPMPWAISSTAFTSDPAVGDQVTVLAESGDPHNQVAFIGASSTDADKGNKVAVARADLVHEELDKIRDAITDALTGPGPPSGDSGALYKENMEILLGLRGDVDANKVKVD